LECQERIDQTMAAGSFEEASESMSSAA
jgi:hypothetical protein